MAKAKKGAVTLVLSKDDSALVVQALKSEHKKNDKLYQACMTQKISDAAKPILKVMQRIDAIAAELDPAYNDTDADEEGQEGESEE